MRRAGRIRYLCLIATGRPKKGSGCAMRRAGIAIAAAALAVGIIAGPQAPALGAQAKAAPTITAVASSKLPPIGGAVWVHFLDPKKKFSTARISGAVAGA